MGQEALYQVLGVLGAVTPPPGKTIEGLPIPRAHAGQGLRAAGGTALGRLEHDGPARRIKVRGIGHARALVLVHGRYAKELRSAHNTLEAQRQGYPQSLD